MSVLVCIPAYNSEGGIEDTVKSVLSQEFQDFKILILDNKSSDRTIEVVERLRKELDHKGKIQIIQNGENIGRVGNWNKCLELFQQSAHEYIKFVFTGDTLEKQCLAILMKAFDEHLEAGFAVGEYEVLYPKGKVLEKHSFAQKKLMRPRVALLRFLLNKNWAGAPISFMLKKDALGGIRFSESLQWGADWRFYIDIASHTHSVYLPDIIGRVDIASRLHYQKLRGSFVMIKEETFIRFYCVFKILTI